jgi:hypothetical protein
MLQHMYAGLTWQGSHFSHEVGASPGWMQQQGKHLTLYILLLQGSHFNHEVGVSPGCMQQQGKHLTRQMVLLCTLLCFTVQA